MVASFGLGRRCRRKVVSRDGEGFAEGANPEISATEDAREAWGSNDAGERKKQ